MEPGRCVLKHNVRDRALNEVFIAGELESEQQIPVSDQAVIRTLIRKRLTFKSLNACAPQPIAIFRPNTLYVSSTTFQLVPDMLRAYNFN